MMGKFVIIISILAGAGQQQGVGMPAEIILPGGYDANGCMYVMTGMNSIGYMALITSNESTKLPIHSRCWDGVQTIDDK